MGSVPPILAPTPFVRATVTNFFFFLSLNGFVLLPIHIQQLGGSEIEIGLVMGLYSGVGILSQALVGPWVDVIGRKPFMLVGIGLNLTAALVAAAPGGIGLLAVVRMLQGVGSSLFFVASFSYVIDIIPPARRGWALGIYGISGFVATAVAPLIGEWLVRTAGFRTLFLFAAGLAVVPGVLVWPLRETPRSLGLPARLAPGAVRAALEDVVHRHMLVAMFFGLGSGTIFAFLPTFAEDLGVTTLALFYTAYSLAAIAVRLAGGRLIDTRGRRAVIVPSMLVTALATGLLALLGGLVTRASAMPVVPVLFVAGLLAGGAHGFLYPALAALVTDATPADRRAAVVGVFSAVMLAGQTAGAFTFGYVANAAGYGAMWGGLTALLLVGLLVSLRLAEPAR
jgi:MFS family permease